MAYYDRDPLVEKLRLKEHGEEDTYFLRRDRELIARLQARHREQEEQSRTAARAHAVSGVRRAADRSRRRGVTTEVCPRGHGLWVPANGLETIHEREHDAWFDRYVHMRRSPARVAAWATRSATSSASRPGASRTAARSARSSTAARRGCRSPRRTSSPTSTAARPGQSRLVTQRKESDTVRILSAASSRARRSARRSASRSRTRTSARATTARCSRSTGRATPTTPTTPSTASATGAAAGARARARRPAASPPARSRASCSRVRYGVEIVAWVSKVRTTRRRVRRRDGDARAGRRDADPLPRPGRRRSG